MDSPFPSRKIRQGPLPLPFQRQMFASLATILTFVVLTNSAAPAIFALVPLASMFTHHLTPARSTLHQKPIVAAKVQVGVDVGLSGMFEKPTR